MTSKHINPETSGDPQSCQQIDGCPTEGAVLKREWRRLTAELDVAREALRAQAASHEDMAVYQGIADGYQRDVQAAGVVPAILMEDAEILSHLEAAGVEFQRFMGGIGGNKEIHTTAGSIDVSKILTGIRTILLCCTSTSAPPAHVPADVEAMRQQAYRLGFLRCTAWAGRDDLEHDVGSPAYLEDQAHDLSTQHPTPSPAQAPSRQMGFQVVGNAPPKLDWSDAEPAQAVDAVDEREALFELVEAFSAQYPAETCGMAAQDAWATRREDALKQGRAALAARQPQAQQGGGENTARAFIEWCKAQPEDRVPVSIDEALDEFEAALANKDRS